MMQMNFKGSSIYKKIVIVLALILMISYVIIIIYPLINMVLSSFKSTREIFLDPFSFPKSFHFENYYKVLIKMGFLRYFFNSIFITFISMVIVLLFGSMASFGLSYYIFKGNSLLYMIFLSGIMLPLKAAIIPLFMMIKTINLMDNPLSVILIFCAMGIPSTIFILSGFFKSIPRDLAYAAIIDGCNDFNIYRKVMMPIIVPAIALVTIYNAVPIYNDFFFPLVFLQSPKFKTLPVGLSTFFGQYGTNWSLVFTGLSVAIIPMLILYLLMSKYFIKGMTAGAIK